MPEIWATCPTKAVIAIPSAPPKTMRPVVLIMLEPAVLALMIPAMIKPINVIPIIEKAFCPRLGARAPRSGIAPPAVKLMAEASAACIGLAFVESC